MSGDAAGPGGARVRVAVEAAVCAEPELAALERGGSVAPGGAAVGRVVSAGEGAAHLSGRRVLVPAIDGCGECDRCRRALPFACEAGTRLGETAPGALGGEVTVRARWALPLDGGLEIAGPLAALVAREAADAYALAARVGLAAGDRVRVHGSGPVAALLHQHARLRGARVVDEADKHLVAGDLTRAIDAAGAGAVVVALARGALDAAGAGALLARGGALLGVTAAHPDLLPEVAALVVKGELDLAAVGEVWECRSPLDQRDELMARTRAALAAGRALVVTLL